MAQEESISRTVIATVIAGIILAGLGVLANWLLPGVRTFFLSVWHWCVHLVSVPVWLLAALSVYVGVSLIRAYLRHRNRTRRRSQTAQKTQQPAEPTWRDYRCDVFHAITWRWCYDYGGQLDELVPFCFKCDTQVHPKIEHIDSLGQSTNYTCDHCRNRVVLKGSHEHVVDFVSRQIQRKLRSPSEEWKNAIKAYGWRGH